MSKTKLQGPRPLRKHRTDNYDRSNPPRSAAEKFQVDLVVTSTVVDVKHSFDRLTKHGVLVGYLYPTAMTELVSSRKGNRGGYTTKSINHSSYPRSFQNWGKRNGYSDEQIKSTFKRFQQRNRVDQLFPMGLRMIIHCLTNLSIFSQVRTTETKVFCLQK